MFNSGYQLKVVEGPGFGRVISLQVAEVGLGRALGPDEPSTPTLAVFPEATVSRQHAKLVWDDRSKHYRIVHLSKTNLTRVNDQVVTREQVLTFGDRISMGRLVLEVQKSARADHLRGGLDSDQLRLPLELAQKTAPSRISAEVQVPLLIDRMPADLEGRRLGMYTLGRELGRGSVGRVYLARHVSHGFDCAVKILAPEVAKNESLLKRFQMEARVASSLRHQNIIQVIDICCSDGLVYLVMELHGPRSLQDIIDHRRGPFPVGYIVNVLEQLLSALDHAHAHGVVHRDVKPGNILVDEKKQSIALTDFSVAKVKDGIRITSLGTVLGTVEYMAPELFEGHSADPRVDIYAVGVILYEMLTGVPPFRGKTTAEIIRAQLLTLPANPQSLNPEVPDWLAQINFIALQKNPEHRYPSAQAMRQNLLQFT